MKNFKMYLCDLCGFSREKQGVCPHCDQPLSAYSKEDQNEYQVSLEDAMRSMSEQQWYI